MIDQFLMLVWSAQYRLSTRSYYFVFYYLDYTVPDTCSDHPGYFGELCTYKCHCQNEAQCDRYTGECPDNQCEEGWGGGDCQQGIFNDDI